MKGVVGDGQGRLAIGGLRRRTGLSQDKAACAKSVVGDGRRKPACHVQPLAVEESYAFGILVVVLLRIVLVPISLVAIIIIWETNKVYHAHPKTDRFLSFLFQMMFADSNPVHIDSNVLLN